MCTGCGFALFSNYGFCKLTLRSFDPVFDDWVARMMPTLVEFRREVHRTPELSFREVKTLNAL